MSPLQDAHGLHPWTLSLLDKSRIATAETVAGGVHREVTPCYARLTGFDASALTRMTVSDLVHPDDRAMFERAEGEPSYRMEVRLVRDDGTETVVRLTGSLGPDGIRRILLEDVTDSARARTDLLAAKERFECAVNGTSDGIWDWNVVTNEDYFSDRWCELLGYRREDLEPCYETWAGLIHPE